LYTASFCLCSFSNLVSHSWFVAMPCLALRSSDTDRAMRIELLATSDKVKQAEPFWNRRAAARRQHCYLDSLPCQSLLKFLYCAGPWSNGATTGTHVKCSGNEYSIEPIRYDRCTDVRSRLTLLWATRRGHTLWNESSSIPCCRYLRSKGLQG